MTGSLYLVATPIGNLEDVTHRAVRMLREADLIACEDTRHTRKLLDHYGISKPVISYHEHNEVARAAELSAKMLGGASVALVSDAGMPLVSDPGYRVVAAAIQAGIPVVPIPGPSAVVAALAASGLATDSFHFGGFLPAKSGQRTRALEDLRDHPHTLIFYEAPHRILEALGDVERVLGPRQVVIARELTKVHEEFLRGPVAEVRVALASRSPVKGEITLLIGKATEPPADSATIIEAVEAGERAGMSRMDAIKEVAKKRGLGKREVYKQIQTPKPSC
ncbi:MAG TPA: 16S rRNA (cytidine(1402)-2'-O)-methyltransferase [Bryobacteraceae bacterium]|nr:16S rRNA (cytidine(1402)-2'-O)-methyltransferase [Bryobacteraceae bacterium]